jgi:hypothetical protein
VIRRLSPSAALATLGTLLTLASLAYCLANWRPIDESPALIALLAASALVLTRSHFLLTQSNRTITLAHAVAIPLAALLGGALLGGLIGAVSGYGGPMGSRHRQRLTYGGIDTAAGCVAGALVDALSFTGSRSSLSLSQAFAAVAVALTATAAVNLLGIAGITALRRQFASQDWSDILHALALEIAVFFLLLTPLIFVHERTSLVSFLILIAAATAIVSKHWNRTVDHWNALAQASRARARPFESASAARIVTSDMMREILVYVSSSSKEYGLLRIGVGDLEKSFDLNGRRATDRILFDLERNVAEIVRDDEAYTPWEGPHLLCLLRDESRERLEQRRRIVLAALEATLDDLGPSFYPTISADWIAASFPLERDESEQRR